MYDTPSQVFHNFSFIFVFMFVNVNMVILTSAKGLQLEIRLFADIGTFTEILINVHCDKEMINDKEKHGSWFTSTFFPAMI